MNLFILDNDPVLSAQYHCNKHVVQMIREGLWILRAAKFKLDLSIDEPGWGDHPLTGWAIDSIGNFTWLKNHTLALVAEYQHRYGKRHAFADELDKLIDDTASIALPKSGNLLPFLQIVPEDCKRDTAVEAYRHYYNTHKYEFAVWTNREPPSWWNPFLVGRHE
jgi:hypothetical protein